MVYYFIRSSSQNDNANVISTFSSGQNIAYGVCSQNQVPFESFTNRSDPTILAAVEYATPFEVLQQNKMTVNDDPGYI